MNYSVDWDGPGERNRDNRDVRVSFSQGMPTGYSVWWLDSHEMYFWQRESDDHWDGPYCDRFDARRVAISDSKQQQ